MRVTWVEAHPSLGSGVIEAADRKFILLDTYCVTEECRCQEVNVTCVEIINGKEAELPTFSATVIPSDRKSLELDCASRDRALAERIWEVWAEGDDVYARLARRQQWMRTLGAELRRRWRDRHEPDVQEKKPAPNQSCPCGSGKKFKRCCGR